jgi:opacity protein-like surface antigen
MMKKALLFIALASSSQILARDESKFYVGTDLGVTMMHGNVEGKSAQRALPGNPPLEYYFKTVTSGWGGTALGTMLTLGYDCRFRGSPLTLGLFGGVGYSGGGYLAPYESIVYDPNNNLENINLNVKIRERIRFNLGMRFGFSMNSLFPHVRFGLATHRIGMRIARPNPVDITQTQTQRAKVDRWGSGLFFGFGCDYAITSSFTIGALVDFSFVKKAKYDFSKKGLFWSATINPPVGIVDDKLAVNLRPTFNTFMISAKWTFPSR